MDQIESLEYMISKKKKKTNKKIEMKKSRLSKAFTMQEYTGTIAAEKKKKKTE